MNNSIHSTGNHIWGDGMKNEAFEKSFAELFGKCGSWSADFVHGCEVIYEAAESASAARIAELEQENGLLRHEYNKPGYPYQTLKARIAELEAANANLEWICDKRQKTIDRQMMRNSDWQGVVDGLKADHEAAIKKAVEDERERITAAVKLEQKYWDDSEDRAVKATAWLVTDNILDIITADDIAAIRSRGTT